MQIPAGGAANLVVPLAARQPRLQRRLRGHADRGAGGRHQGVEPGRPRARRALLDVRVPPASSRADRLRRLAAVASADRRRQLHPRLARGARRGGRDEHEVVPFAPTSAPGRRSDPRGARRAPGRAAAAVPALRALLAAGLEPRSGGRRSSASSGRSTCCTSPTGCTRRSAAGCARRWCTTSCRCVSRSGCRGGRGACTARSTATPRAPAT